jgi:hypothetical protein
MGATIDVSTLAKRQWALPASTGSASGFDSVNASASDSWKTVN